MISGNIKIQKPWKEIKMDKRTRVLAAMNGEKVDHVPVGFWFHFGGDEAIGEACVNAHLKYYRETDLDFVKIMCDGYFPFPLPLIRKAEDWNRVKPLEADDPFITEKKMVRIHYRIHNARFLFLLQLPLHDLPALL